jgi:signal transduction histidine kinase
MAFAGAWIIWSDGLVRSVSTTVEEMERFEHAKGLFFVLATGLALFASMLYLLRRSEEEALRAATARETLLQLERHSLAGLFVSSIVHDANNVATVVSSALDELKTVQSLDGDAREAVDDAGAALTRLRRLFTELKDMGKGHERGVRLETQLDTLIARTVALLRGHSAMKHCPVKIDVEVISMPVFPVLIDQMLINLLINAADATDGRGHVEVARAPTSSSRCTTNTTKPRDTGLGLLSVRECAHAHGGEVSCSRSPLGGACFRVSLPGTAVGPSP